MMTLNEDILIGCAFRYALGRRTYVVDSVCSEIERRVADISLKTRHRFIKEIDEAITEERAGMQMDIDRWNKCRDIITESLDPNITLCNHCNCMTKTLEGRRCGKCGGLK